MATTPIYPYGQGGQAASGLGVVNDLTTGGADKALSAEQGKELGGRTEMDVDKVIPSLGGYINSNGTVSTSSSRLMTPYVRIDPTKKVYAMGESNNSSVALIAFYNDNLQFISAVSNVGAAGVEYEANVPSGATLARSSCLTTQVANGKAYLTQKVHHEVNETAAANKEKLAETINLIDGVRIYKGYLVDGKLSANLARTTDYIRIDEGLEFEYAVNTYFSVSCQVAAFYASRDEASYISGIQNQGSGGYTKLREILTIPAGAKWIRLCAAGDSDLAACKLTCKAIDYYKLLANIPNEVRPLTPARLLLPKFMDVAVGRQCDFWVDDYISNPEGLPIRYNEPSGVVMYDNGHLRVTPSSAGTVDFIVSTFSHEDEIKMAANNNDIRIGSQTMTIRKVASSGGSGSYNVLIVGDSLVQYGPNAAETYRLLAEDADVTINQIGTKTQTLDGVTYRHEGEGGWKWSDFVRGSSSPFVKNGVFSFSTYMADNFQSLSGIDFCIVMLGTNDNADNVAADSKTFIDQLLADYPNCKIAVGIPALGGDYAGYLTPFEDKIRRVAATYLDLYDNGKYNANVTCVGQGCWIDRKNDYPTVDENMTPYSTATFKRFDTGGQVHPSVQGYKQWGRAVYCKIRSWIAGNL